MKRILHISDFHLTPNTDKTEEISNKIKKLIEKLNGPVDIIVYTGDIIDFKYINEKLEKEYELILDKNKNIVNKSKIKKFQEIRKKLLKESFDFSEQFFRQLKDGLLYKYDTNKRKNERFVFCCGNHDRIINYDAEIDCFKGNEEENFKAYFSLFNKFCVNIIGKQNAYLTNFRKIDDLNFLIINCNWDNKHFKRCINCLKIEKIIDKNKDVLEKAYNKSNIVVMHTPEKKLCDYSTAPYSENKHNPIFSTIKRYFGLILCGDTHTYNNDEGNYISDDTCYESIVGCPISRDNIHYGLYEIDSDSKTFKNEIISIGPRN